MTPIEDTPMRQATQLDYMLTAYCFALLEKTRPFNLASNKARKIYVKKSCFIKNISRNRNHKALVHFAVNNHMYLILDDTVRKSLIERTKVINIILFVIFFNHTLKIFSSNSKCFTIHTNKIINNTSVKSPCIHQ